MGRWGRTVRLGGHTGEMTLTAPFQAKLVNGCLQLGVTLVVQASFGKKINRNMAGRPSSNLVAAVGVGRSV